MGLILDSSVLIAAERGQFDWIGWQSTILDEPQFITVITLSELWHGWHRAKTDEQRARRAHFIRGIESRYPILGIGLAEARIHARLWAELSAKGRLIGAHDLLIAAIAISHGYGLATLNHDEFCRVPGLNLAELQPFFR